MSTEMAFPNPALLPDVRPMGVLKPACESGVPRSIIANYEVKKKLLVC